MRYSEIITSPFRWVEADARNDLTEDAFHGSPHSFDRFSSAHISTGEGNQAYGWGLYFAGRKEVADWFRTVLTATHSMGINKSRMVGDMPSRLEMDVMKHVNERFRSSLQSNRLEAPWFSNVISFYNAANNMIPALDRGFYSKNAEAIEAKIDQFANRYRDDPAYRARYHEMVGTDAKPDWSHFRSPYASAYASARAALFERLAAKGYKGNLYTVNIPDEDEYLLWDALLGDQSAPVKAALAKIKHPVIDLWRTNGTWDHAKGGTFYDVLAGGTNGNAAGMKAASATLADLGVAGIKYLDGTSRGAGDGTYNYVVFDENRLSIKGVE